MFEWKHDLQLPNSSLDQSGVAAIARPGRRLIRENDLGAEFFYVVESGALLTFYFSELVGWQSQVGMKTGEGKTGSTDYADLYSGCK